MILFSDWTVLFSLPFFNSFVWFCNFARVHYYYWYAFVTGNLFNNSIAVVCISVKYRSFAASSWNFKSPKINELNQRDFDWMKSLSSLQRLYFRRMHIEVVSLCFRSILTFSPPQSACLQRDNIPAEGNTSGDGCFNNSKFTVNFIHPKQIYEHT